MTWARAEKARAFIIIYSIAQAMSVSGHSRKTLAGTNSGERTFCAAAHPADVWF